MSTQNRLFTAMTPSFCSLTDTEQSLQYTIKTHLSGPPMPKFKANMNYIPPSPPSSMKQCNKSATVKFHMELLLILRPGSNLALVRHQRLCVSWRQRIAVVGINTFNKKSYYPCPFLLNTLPNDKI